MKQQYKHLLILLIIAVLLATVFYSGANNTFDDALYMKYASQALAGTFSSTATPYAYSLAFIYSIAGMKALLGSIGPSILQMLEYLAIPCIIYLTLLKYTTPKIALATSICTECSMFLLGYASRVLPDMMLGVIIALLFLILSYKRESIRWMLVAGFLSGATIFAKMGGFVLLILLGFNAFPALISLTLLITVAMFFLNRRRGVYLIGLFAALLLFQLFMPLPLTHLAQAYSANQAKLSGASLSINILTGIVQVIGYWQFYSVQTFPLGAVIIFAIIGTLIALIKRYNQYYFVILAFWSAFFYLYLGTESLQSWTYITVVSRYFIEFAAPMAILACCFLDSLRKFASENKILFYAILITLATNLPMYIIFYYNRLPVFGAM